MAQGFSKVEVPDPNKIVDFIEFSTDAMAGIFEVGYIFFMFLLSIIVN